jgi:hypothetical protein
MSLKCWGPIFVRREAFVKLDAGKNPRHGTDIRKVPTFSAIEDPGGKRWKTGFRSDSGRTPQGKALME